MYQDEYRERGFCIAREAIDPSAIDGVLDAFLALTNRLSGERFASAHAPELARRLKSDIRLQAASYDGFRDAPAARALAQSAPVTAIAQSIIARDTGLFSKIPYRIDVPMETKELAVWHQDYWYVRGNTDVVTAWIPMQDTTYLNGCLAVMPGSHKLGALEHDQTVLGKRHFPSAHLGGEIRLAEMKKGDVLFFHSCLLHTGNINLSNAVRYSIQARYTPLGAPVDKNMGEVIEL